MTLTGDCEVANAIRTRVAERMQLLPLGEDFTSDEELTSEEDQHATCRHRPLKSGMDRMGAKIVVKNIT